MTTELSDTNASQISAALISERRKAGSPLMGMVMTFVVVTEESDSYDAIRHARTVSREHPARILAVIRRSGRGRANLDAELTIGAAGESVLLRMSGELTQHAESVVLPLLLPDSPVVVWWPGKAPEDPAKDSIGILAQRRITDSASLDRGKAQAILTQARCYADGNTDLAWTRLTPWRALLCAALDQYPASLRGAVVEAERTNPSADLLVAWLAERLKVEVTRAISKGPGITSVTLHTGGGPIAITRPDGLLAQFTIPNSPDRPVALKRRDLPELLAEELRRLDPDDIYAATVRRLCKLADRAARGSTTAGSRGPAGKRSSRPTAGQAQALPRSTQVSKASPTGSATLTSDSTSARTLAERAAPSDAKTPKRTSSKKAAAGTKTSTRRAAATKTAAKGTATRKTAGKSAAPAASRRRSSGGS